MVCDNPYAVALLFGPPCNSGMPSPRYTGDARVCDPKTYYECTVDTMARYVQEHRSSMCDCPRQCRRLSYEHDISQALVSDRMVMAARSAHRLNGTLNDIRYDYCSLEASARLQSTDGHVSKFLDPTTPVVSQMFNLLKSAVSRNFVTNYKNYVPC